jgi:hypothetical protein
LFSAAGAVGERRSSRSHKWRCSPTPFVEVKEAPRQSSACTRCGLTSWLPSCGRNWVGGRLGRRGKPVTVCAWSASSIQPAPVGSSVPSPSRVAGCHRPEPDRSGQNGSCRASSKKEILVVDPGVGQPVAGSSRKSLRSIVPGEAVLIGDEVKRGRGLLAGFKKSVEFIEIRSNLTDLLVVDFFLK